MGGRYLVTGGAGFVGSHIVAGLLDRGDTCVVFDNLTTGHAAAVLPGASLIIGDLADPAAIDAAMAMGPWDAVLHFASLSLVGESMRDPMRYLIDNPGNAGRLIDACVRHGVRRFVFSSTAALFGTAGPGSIGEATAVEPGSAYGESKHMVERMLHWAGQVHGLNAACLRYFNAAGADLDGRLGEHHSPETHLIPLVIETALGLRAELVVNGTDYDTPDGTCIRDYVHVTDLATAHLQSIDQLAHGSVVYNLGTGRGHSVLEVIRAVERISGLPVPYRLAGRRPGDPAMLVASPDRIMRETGWTPRHSSLDEIVTTALAWKRQHMAGYG